MLDHINKIKNSKGRTSTLFSEVSSEYMSMYSKSFPDRIPIKIPNSSSVKYVEVHYSEITFNNLKRDFSEALKLSTDLQQKYKDNNFVRYFVTKLFKGTKMIRANFNKDNDPKHYGFWKKLLDKNKNDAKIKELIDSEAESRAVKKNVLKSIEGHDIPEIYEICTIKELQTLL